MRSIGKRPLAEKREGAAVDRGPCVRISGQSGDLFAEALHQRCDLRTRRIPLRIDGAVAHAVDQADADSPAHCGIRPVGHFAAVRKGAAEVMVVREGRVRVLVATDIASRGIDVPDVDLVVNMELPNETESYVHRIGRTARAGESGTAISFVAPEERSLLKAVERFVRQTIPVDRDQPFHSGAAEQKAGKANQGLPQAPWVGRGEKGPRGFRSEEGEKGKKFVHPAKRNRKRRNRPNFKGRGQPDFRKK